MTDVVKKQQAFAQQLARLLLQITQMGYGATMGEAWRPQPMCDWYAAHGYGIRHSNHEKRLAVDLNLFDAAGNYLALTDPAYAAVGAWWKSQSDTPGCPYTCCWGGDFHDADHFSFEDGGVK